MKCIDPVLCFATQKRTVYRNWSFARNSPYLRAMPPTHVLNCGKCIICRKRRSIELAARCVLHASLYERNAFLTLTHDESRPGYHNNFDYTEIQKFKKRLRQHVWRNHQQRIEVFNVHEYGKNGKKHWHLIVFNYSPHQEPDSKGQPDCRLHTRSNGIGLYVSEALSRLWRYGFSTVGDISEASAMYAAQYLEKDFRNGNITNVKRSHSKHSGLAKPYFLKHYSQILLLGYIPFSGRKLPVPRYFRRLAHRHYCHFFEPVAFVDTRERKALYRPFKPGHENLEIAKHYVTFKENLDIRKAELELEFEEVIKQYLCEKELPDFVKSGNNFIYDLNNKISTSERF